MRLRRGGGQRRARAQRARPLGRQINRRRRRGRTDRRLHPKASLVAVAASRKSAAGYGEYNGGALPRRRYGQMGVSCASAHPAAEAAWPPIGVVGHRFVLSAWLSC